MSILLDSDIVIEILRSRDQAILSQWEALASTGRLILFSPITAAEIWAGARPNERQATSLFFSHLTCIPIEYNIGNLAGEFLRQFSKSHNLKIGDALIAAAAVQNQAALWTRNRKHYPMTSLTFYS
jgi:predicted nucleic acid-binding protein